MPFATSSRIRSASSGGKGGSVLAAKLDAQGLFFPAGHCKGAARMLPDPRDLLVHCAQEMNHLTGLPPALFSRFANE